MKPITINQRVADFFVTDAKHFAKKFYKKPIIKLSRLYRTRLDHVRFIGITGSSGKTTTKELVHLLLSNSFQTHKSEDSNNQIYSVARTILSTPRKAKLCVQELGISHEEDLTDSVKLFRPNIGVVLNIGTEHYKAFRGREYVAKEKIKLIQGLPENGVAVLNADDDYVIEMMSSINCKIFTFGYHSDCDLQVVSVRNSWPEHLSLTLRYQNETIVCVTQLCGEHLVHSVLAALAVGLINGISLSELVNSAKKFTPFLARMMPYETSSGITFIRDDWKAPYWSIFESIKFIKNSRAKRKVIVIGTISDYSGTSSSKYRKVCNAALEAADHVYFVGMHASSAIQVKKIPDDKTLRAFSTVEELANYLKDILLPEDLVLLKASCGDYLARIALMYDHDVRCWRINCGRNLLCDNCKLLSIS